MSTKITALIALGVAMGLAGCSGMPETMSAAPSGASSPSGTAYSYPSSARTLMGNSYQSGPYDNTGNGPGETGMEGGGG